MKRYTCLTIALMALLLWNVAPAYCQIVKDGLISYWSMDENTIINGKVKDLIGGQDAAINGSPKSVDGKVKGALNFNGTSDYLEVSKDINTMIIPTKEITLEAWVYPENFIEWGGYLSCFQDNGSFEKGWTLGCNWNMTFALSTESPNEGDGTLTYLQAQPADANKWYHLVGTYDGKTMSVYVNGNLENSIETHSGNINYPDHAFLTIGVYKDDNEFFPFKGMLDEVKLYKKALSKSEVLQNFNATSMAVSAVDKASITWGRIKSEK